MPRGQGAGPGLRAASGLGRVGCWHCSPVTHAEVMIMARNQVRLDVECREPFAGGGSFGDTGPYERLCGRVHFAIDPDEKGLPYIVDLDLAPRNARGLGEFGA